MQCSCETKMYALDIAFHEQSTISDKDKRLRNAWYNDDRLVNE